MNRQVKQLDLKSKIKTPLHHAYVIIGSEEHVDDILGFIESLGHERRGNPDLYIKKYSDGLGVDDARELRRQSLANPIAGEKKFFVLWVPQITIEAQNALLKILEEPSGQSHFFILAPSSGMFIPTVLSRIEIVNQDGGKETAREEELAGSFLGMSPIERLDLAEIIAKEKDRQRARDIVTGLVIKVEKFVCENPEDKKWQESLRQVSKMERYIKGRSPSIKMILEHLALFLPVVK
jgi:DNA polymerase III delta prime subunit